MFSQGQLTFGIIFAIVFSGVIIYAYRKDFNLHQSYYKGSLWILLVFIGFIAGIAAIKFLLGY
jgi:cbb3-type cytochrome oxidase subunit 3